METQSTKKFIKLEEMNRESGRAAEWLLNKPPVTVAQSPIEPVRTFSSKKKGNQTAHI